ncbi:MAG TPA: 50S ribosomal protein L9 [Oscillatoriales cyanobacterium M59_W2019_021]|nr:MAG: 50S ribosomal protein L9 [Cyanobacteria bacterium J055]HIK30796.1 50S ribosomal protein L9 [Oscillatoriales cyanobacterium M4454_W2019_049]HIK50812.1 50S ribosomal protein L9 [Oscillatoriales cyanobacterium M59_W2019_021]
MAKRIQLLLNQDVRKLGKAGEVVEVAPGYARNYLIPQNIGVRTTPGILKMVEWRKQKEQERLISIKQEAESRKQALQTIGRFTIKKQVGEKDAIFGTVTDREVVEAIQAATNQEIDRRGVTLPEISKTGFYKAQVKLHPEVTAEIEIHVAPL